MGIFLSITISMNVKKMSEAGRILPKIFEVTANPEDLQSLRIKVLEQRINELEDVIEEICMIIDADVTSETDSDEDMERFKTDAVIGVVKALNKSATPAKKTSTKRTTRKKKTTAE